MGTHTQVNSARTQVGSYRSSTDGVKGNLPLLITLSQHGRLWLPARTTGSNAAVKQKERERKKKKRKKKQQIFAATAAGSFIIVKYYEVYTAWKRLLIIIAAERRRERSIHRHRVWGRVIKVQRLRLLSLLQSQHQILKDIWRDLASIYSLTTLKYGLTAYTNNCWL